MVSNSIYISSMLFIENTQNQVKHLSFTPQKQTLMVQVFLSSFFISITYFLVSVPFKVQRSFSEEHTS